MKLGETEDVIQVGGNVRLDPINGRLLADILPPLIHVRAASAQAPVLQWLLAERTQDLPGSSLAAAETALLLGQDSQGAFAPRRRSTERRRSLSYVRGLVRIGQSSLDKPIL